MSVAMLVIGIIAVGVLFYQVMAGFFVPLFLAAVLVVIFRPVHLQISRWLGGRSWLAGLTTTLFILLMVLMPIIALISVAASQLTFVLRHVGSNDITEAIDRVRDRMGLALPYADQFRRLDELADSLSKRNDTVTSIQGAAVCIQLIDFLQENVEGPVTAQPAAELARINLQTYIDHFTAAPETTDVDVPSASILAPADRQAALAVSASASIRAWMNTLLGGTVRSQLRLIPTPSESDVASWITKNREALQPRFLQLTSVTGGIAVQFIIGLGILVISVYFFLVDGPGMIRTLMRLSPLDDEYEQRLLTEFDSTSRAVVLASVLSALAQGVLATIGFYFAGLESLVLLFLITTAMALVPFLGAASVWVLCCLWLGLVQQQWTTAIVLAIYSAVFVSSIDNVIKVYVLHGRSQLHPLFALLSVLGGMQVFGPIGFVVGPMVVVFLQSLLEILNHELEK
jgi:predicted PurR-regulated permease PerM